MEDIEDKAATRLEESLALVREDMREEKNSRQILEEHVRLLEDQIARKVFATDGNEDVVLSRFGERDVTKAEKLVKELRTHVDPCRVLQGGSNALNIPDDSRCC